MADHPVDGNALPPGDPDLGAPVAELRDLSLPLGSAFPDKVRGRIERRLLASELIGLALSAPLAVGLELLQALMELLTGRQRR